VKQVVQNLRSGVLELLEVPCPRPAHDHLLVQSRASLISADTERSLVEFGKANLLAKARQNPERVKQVLAQTFGALTIDPGDGADPVAAALASLRGTESMAC
jgi:hypothetical protein